MFRKKNIIVLAFCILAYTSKAQNNGLGSWNILNIKYNYNSKISAFAEGQLRSLQFYNSFHYYEYKFALQYKVHKNVQVSLGAGSYQTFKEGGNFVLPKNNDEFRLWPQISFIQNIGKFEIEQRYRAEMRFKSSGYANRFRYRLGVSLPLSKNKAIYPQFKTGLSNEIFFTDREPYFERNRMQVNLNMKINKSSSIQTGYLHQFDYRINDETGRDFLVVGFYKEINRK